MTIPIRLKDLVAAIYAWILAIFLGAVLLDIVYSNQLNGAEGPHAVATVFGEVADFLILLGAAAVVFALAATAVAWRLPSARNLFLLSLLLLAFEWIGPVVLFPIFRSLSGSPVQGLGPFLRLLPTTLASLAAFGGARAVFLHQDRGAPG